MAKFTMTEFMEDTEKKYGDMELEVPVRNEKRELVLDEEGQPQTKVARFRYFLRINQADRSRLAEAFKYVNGEKEVEQEDGEDGIAQRTKLLQETVRSLAVGDEDYDLVYNTFGEDFIYWTKFMELYDANFAEGDDSGE